MSQALLAEKAALSINAISAFERGSRFPRAETFDALTSAFELEAGGIMSRLLSLGDRRRGGQNEVDEDGWHELLVSWSEAPTETRRLITAVARALVEQRQGLSSNLGPSIAKAAEILARRDEGACRGMRPKSNAARVFVGERGDGRV